MLKYLLPTQSLVVNDVIIFAMNTIQKRIYLKRYGYDADMTNVIRASLINALDSCMGWAGRAQFERDR